MDSTDRDRLSITKEELHKMMGHDELSKANILVFANKQDVKGMYGACRNRLCSGGSAEPSMSAEKPRLIMYFFYVKGCLSAAEISKHLNLQSMRQHKWQIQACCALTGEG